MNFIANCCYPHIRTKINLFFLLCVSGFIFSCNTTKNLKSGETLLTQNKIELLDISTLNEKILFKQELGTLFKQKPNRTYLFFFKRHAIYNYLEARKNKKVWFRKSLSKQAEPPAILDTFLVKATMSNMYNYMYNKGYFSVIVAPEIVRKKNKTSTVKYLISANKRTFVESIEFQAEDTSIDQLLHLNQSGSMLKPGSPLDNALFQSEKARITDLMLNNGYAEFNPVYIQNLDADTTGTKAKVKVTVANPDQRSSHTRYTVGSVRILGDYNPLVKNIFSQTKLDSISFFNSNKISFIKDDVLLRNIELRPGRLYNKSNIDLTYLNLANLEYYKFINIETKLDSNQSDKLNHTIFLTPYKKWVTDYGTDLNYTTLRTTGRNLFGVSGYINLKNRNLFHGAENFDTKVEVGAELNFVDTFGLNTINISYSNTLTLPDFYDITGTYQLSRLMLRPFIKLRKELKSKTAFSLGFDYVNLAALFSYNSFNAKIAYDYYLNRRNRIILTTLEVSYYKPTVFPAFQNILATNQALEQSFIGKRLFTAFFLSSLKYYYQSKKSSFIDRAFIVSLETSGLEASLVNSVGKLINSNSTGIGNNTLELAKFIKIDADHRWYYYVNSQNTIALRGAAGLAVPFGGSKTIPYIKQFFLGGPQSLRAWGIREPGPGGDPVSSTLGERGNYYSAGDIKLEANAEWRFDIIWIFKGAIFLDAGNVWRLPQSGAENNLGNFSKKFYEQIAFGTGFGLRMDLSYFLFRVDLGFKLRNPYLNETNRYWIYSKKDPVNWSSLFKNSNIHLALNYPF